MGRYYKGYNAVEVAVGFTDDQHLIALVTGIEAHVVAQYYALVEKYRPDKMLKNQSHQGALVTGHMP